MSNDMTGMESRICLGCHQRKFWTYIGSNIWNCLSCRRFKALARGSDLPEFTHEPKD